MTIYISTGGYKSKPADQTVKDLLSSGVKEIELSGGVYHPNLMDNLTKFLKIGLETGYLNFTRGKKDKRIKNYYVTKMSTPFFQKLYSFKKLD